MRTLGIDWGVKRLGLALSDLTGAVASPLKTITRKGNRADIREITELTGQHEVERIVVGIPLNMDGRAGESAGRVTKFSKMLEEAVDVPVILVDERYSSQAAERAMLEADLSRKKRREKRDGVAAAWFLQAYLDSQPDDDIK